MWKVRLLGIDDNGFNFLKDLSDDVFCSQKNNGNFIEHFVCIKGHDDEEPEKILEIAEKELKPYIFILKQNGDAISNLKLDLVCKVHGDGSDESYMFFKEIINFSDNLEIFENGEGIYSSNQDKIKKYKIILEKSSNNMIKKDLLILLGLEHNWPNGYKIYEILKKYYKPEPELKRHQELKYFAHSANSPDAIGKETARHAVQDTQNPKKISDLKTAYNKLIELSLKFITTNDDH